jgi:hypothetical protein
MGEREESRFTLMPMVVDKDGTKIMGVARGGRKAWEVPGRRKAVGWPAQSDIDEEECVVPGARTVAWLGGPQTSQNVGW